MNNEQKIMKALIQTKQELDKLKKELEIVKEYLRKQHQLKFKTK
jgi:hypothetical protein